MKSTMVIIMLLATTACAAMDPCDQLTSGALQVCRTDIADRHAAYPAPTRNSDRGQSQQQSQDRSGEMSSGETQSQDTDDGNDDAGTNTGIGAISG